MHIYIYIYTHTNLPDIYIYTHKFTSQCHSQTTPSSEWRFLAPSADKQTHNYNTRVLKPTSLPINAKVKGIEP